MGSVLLDRLANWWEARFDTEDSIGHFSPTALEGAIYSRLHQVYIHEPTSEVSREIRRGIRENRRMIRADLRMLSKKDPSLYERCLSDYCYLIKTGNLPEILPRVMSN